MSVKLQNFDFDEMLGKVWGCPLDWIYIGVLLLLDPDSRSARSSDRHTRAFILFFNLSSARDNIPERS